MELSRLKVRLKTAVRGHKLLKDKSDEMIRKFLVLAQRNRDLRVRAEDGLSEALRGFVMARTLMMPQDILQAVSMPAASVEVEASYGNIMGLPVPKLTLGDARAAGLYPYSFASTAAGLDASISQLSAKLPDLLRLAEIEKSCNLLADEIERNRRRVNALEFILIPQIEETIKYIKMKLDENERGNLTRLMKVKAMLQEKAEE
jgi:V/A-type H+-transporting ATPase subunit D